MSQTNNKGIFEKNIYKDLSLPMNLLWSSQVLEFPVIIVYTIIILLIIMKYSALKWVNT